MHERGYTFMGESSFYRLTLPEMRVLYAGYQVTKQEQQDQQRGVKPQHREGLSEFADQRQRGDWAANHNVTP